MVTVEHQTQCGALLSLGCPVTAHKGQHPGSVSPVPKVRPLPPTLPRLYLAAACPKIVENYGKDEGCWHAQEGSRKCVVFSHTSRVLQVLFPLPETLFHTLFTWLPNGPSSGIS